MNFYLTYPTFKQARYDRNYKRKINLLKMKRKTLKYRRRFKIIEILYKRLYEIKQEKFIKI